ncbi:formimidoylglutamate deiminase [Pantoea sp. 1.19]|uniref:formimidoylglutamate deiminase n=1 Tax=Pantoea sp. 1.19 TaxID=1925589 RepID=UPI00094918B3|nr:formimidoylglutamate deiminase [Pantoea sp. 1.19]
MSVWFATRALLREGWRENVRIEVDAQGNIARLQPDSPAADAARLSGPVVPAMSNLHSHAFQRAMAGLAEVAGHPQDSFWSWRDLMYRMVARLSPDQVGAIARWLYIDMVKGGYTQVAEFHYLHHDPAGRPYADDAMLQQLIAAAESAGIGQTLLPVLYSYSGFGAQPPLAGQQRFIQDSEAYLAQQQRLQRLLIGKPLHRAGLCFHSLRAVSEQQIREVLDASPASGPIHIHIAEQQKEVSDCLAWSGQRPLSWLYDHFPVDDRWCLVHATHLDDREMQRLARSGAVAGLCPTTEANLGDGIFPADSYIRAGGRWGIGSDSHVSVDVVEELRWLEYAQRLRERRRNRITLPQQPSVGDLLWQQAAQGGAQACGVVLGELAVGQRADWLVLDEDALLATLPAAQLLNRWLFAGRRQQIRDVWVAGRPVVIERRHADETAADAGFRQAMAALQ